MKNKYQKYTEKMQKIADIRNAAAVLQWDEETYLPEKGATFRGQQLATLNTLAHEKATEKELGNLLLALSQDDSLNLIQKGNIQRSLENYKKSQKYPSLFVHKLSMTSSECFHSWLQARKENNFECYKPALSKMVTLKQEEAELLGYHNHPYNALLDDFEKGATVEMVDQVFQQVKTKLKPLIENILSHPSIDHSILHQSFDPDKQWDFSLTLLQAIGFDFQAGRQDLSEHPFTTSFNPKDVRVTTRVDENNFAFLCWSSIHEGGHALYEQGLSEKQYGLPAGEAHSLSIHESQSRFWENNIGRSLPFWQHFYPQLQRQFPQQLEGKKVEQFYQAMNKVERSPIRTEADELTYHFHILIRYEIEKDLISGKISPNELKEAWNAAYKKHLGIEIKEDNSGVLQDIHWCHGGFGYFPTYSLGSFYAAQFYHTLENEIPLLSQKVAQGEFTALLDWLRKNIHQHGSLYQSEELCKKVTGQPLNFNFFMDYARNKYKAIYP